MARTSSGKKTPSPPKSGKDSPLPLEAPRPIPPTKPNQPMQYKLTRVHKVVAYGNHERIHSLCDPYDPNFAKGEWLVRWARMSPEKDSWLPHATCIEYIAPALINFISKLYLDPEPHGMSVGVNYVSAIEDVIVKRIVVESEAFYFMELAKLSESFVHQATHPNFSKNIGKTITLLYTNNNPYMYLPKKQLRYIYPEIIDAWDALELSQRPRLDLQEIDGFTRLDHAFIVQDDPNRANRGGSYTTVKRPSTQSTTGPPGCTATQFDLSTCIVATGRSPVDTPPEND